VKMQVPNPEQNDLQLIMGKVPGALDVVMAINVAVRSRYTYHSTSTGRYKGALS
jgi:hypothetical protein